MTLAILVIDLLTVGSGLHYEFGRPRDGKRKLRRVLDAAQASNIPIMAFQYSPQGLAPDPLDKLVYDYVPRGEIATKGEYDAFVNTGLAERLQQAGVDAVLVAGFDRDHCVLQTAKGALEWGFKVLASEHLMFTTIPWPRESCRRLWSLAYFRENTTYFDSLSDLISYLKTMKQDQSLAEAMTPTAFAEYPQ